MNISDYLETLNGSELAHLQHEVNLSSKRKAKEYLERINRDCLSEAELTNVSIQIMNELQMRS